MNKVFHTIPPVTMLLLGCTAIGPWDVWEPTPSSKSIEGPLNVGALRPPVLIRRKLVSSPYGNPYAYAFTDSFGKKIDVFDTLLQNLDEYSKNIENLKPWITKEGTTEFRQGQQYPFKMYLLTISPEIVLVVPAKNKRSEDRCLTLFLQGCLQSQTFRGGAYWFQASPKIADGSYWFSLTEGDAKVHQLDVSSESTEITTNHAALRLTKSADEWHVERIR